MKYASPGIVALARAQHMRRENSEANKLLLPPVFHATIVARPSVVGRCYDGDARRPRAGGLGERRFARRAGVIDALIFLPCWRGTGAHVAKKSKHIEAASRRRARSRVL